MERARTRYRDIKIERYKIKIEVLGSEEKLARSKRSMPSKKLFNIIFIFLKN